MTASTQPALHAQAPPALPGAGSPRTRYRSAPARRCAGASAAARSARSRCTRAARSRAAAETSSCARCARCAMDPTYGHHQRRRRADREHVPDALHAPRRRGEVPAPVVHPPDGVQAARHEPRPDEATAEEGARGARASSSVRVASASAWTSRASTTSTSRTWRAPRRRPSEGRARSCRPQRTSG